MWLRKAFVIFSWVEILFLGEKVRKPSREENIMTKEKARNCSIDIFRYVCAIMVVGIHTWPLSDFSCEAGDIFSNIVPRIAVPFFFAVAGYFYVQKLEKGQNPFFPYVKRLLIPYFIWSVIYNTVDFIAREHSDIKYFLAGCLYRFIVTGTWEHFWFFPALLFAVCATTLVFKAGGKNVLIPFSICLYVIGCLGCSYYKLAVGLPGLGSLFLLPQFDLVRRVLLMGFPFFVCGYLVYRIENRMEKPAMDRRLYLVAGVAAAVWLAEIGMVRIFEWENNIILTFGLYPLVVVIMLILLRNPMPTCKNFSGKCAVLADFTYYSHPLCMEALSLLSFWLLNQEMPATLMFLLTVAITAMMGLLIHIAEERGGWEWKRKRNV